MVRVRSAASALGGRTSGRQEADGLALEALGALDHPRARRYLRVVRRLVEGEGAASVAVPVLVPVRGRFRHDSIEFSRSASTMETLVLQGFPLFIEPLRVFVDRLRGRFRAISIDHGRYAVHGQVSETLAKTAVDRLSTFLARAAS